MTRTLAKARRLIRLVGARHEALEIGRNRLVAMAAVFALGFLLIGGRLVSLTLDVGETEPTVARSGGAAPSTERADIVDRNGVVLASSLPTAALYANPRDVLDPVETARAISTLFPDVAYDSLLARLRSETTFVWIKRSLTPRQKYEVNRLGLPGVYFQRGERRVYPHGNAASHVIGLTDVDGRGLTGAEQYFDARLKDGSGPLQLSLDIRAQTVLRDTLAESVARFGALGGSAIMLDVRNGEIVALVSLPDFDPNQPSQAVGEAAFNRTTKGVYEMGSTFKVLTTAIALETGTVNLQDGYDASTPIRVGGFTISDFHGKKRWLSVPEILVYSSNIGAAKMAVDIGAKNFRSYLDRLGLLTPAHLELPEVGDPLSPQRWRDINTMTIGFGHGIAVSPVQMAAAVAATVNGGTIRPASILVQSGQPHGTRVFSDETSRRIRELLRLVVTNGTGRKADVPGYQVGGKTGTAEKLGGRGYRADSLVSSFIGIFPGDDPAYVVLALLDEPKGIAETQGNATGSWTAAPMVGQLVQRLGPLLGVAPGVVTAQGQIASEAQLIFTRATGARSGERRLATN